MQEMSTKLCCVVLFVRLRPVGKHCKPRKSIRNLKIPSSIHNLQTSRTSATCQDITLEYVSKPGKSNRHRVGIT